MEKIIKEQIGDVIYYHAENHDKRFYVKIIDEESGIPCLCYNDETYGEIELKKLGYVGPSTKTNFIYQVENLGIDRKGPGFYIKTSFKYNKTADLRLYCFYVKDNWPKLYPLKPRTIVNGSLDEIFINPHHYIYDLEDKYDADKGGRISGVNGQLNRKHSIIYTKKIDDDTYAEVEKVFKEKNIILIKDIFPQTIFDGSTTLSLEEITYGIDANTLEVVTPIYSMRQQAFIDIEQDAFINNGGEYPSWAMGHFNESDFDATVVFKILAPLITIPTKGPDILNSDGNINDAFAKRLLLKK